MAAPLFLVSLVETLNKLGELVWYAFIDDIRVHCAQLLAELVLDIRTQPALLPLHLVGSHAHGRVRRLPHLLVHLTRPPVQTPMRRDSRIPGWYNAWAIQMVPSMELSLPCRRYFPTLVPGPPSNKTWRQRVRRERIMLTAQSVKDHLPVLRRYARALTGSQE